MTKIPRVGSEAWLRWAYRLLRREYFEGYGLPQRLPVKWATLPGTIIARVRWESRVTTKRTKVGKKSRLVMTPRWSPTVMHIDRKLKGRHLQKQVGMSMIHEMAHLVCGIEVACEEWGGPFDKLMFKLCRRGAFQKFW